MSNSKTRSFDNHIQDIEKEGDSILWQIEDEWRRLTGNNKTDFVQSTFQKLLSNPETSGNEFVHQPVKDNATYEELHAYLYLNPLLIVMGYLAEAIKIARLASENDNSFVLIAESFWRISKSKFYLGMIAGRSAIIQADTECRSKKAKKAANARHKENHQLKEEARLFYKAGDFKNKDSAAGEIVKQVPIAFSTARKWVTEFSKKQ